jgi:hypothetical protein
VEFKPSPTRGKVLSKFAARTLPGLFLGWHVAPGGRFRGDYVVIALSDVPKKDFAKHPKSFIQRVKEIYVNKENKSYFFPCKDEYERKRRTISSTEVNVGDDVSKQKAEPFENVTESVDVPQPPKGEFVDADRVADDWLIPSESLDAVGKPADDSGPGGASTIKEQEVQLYESGRTTRTYKNTPRPPYIWPETWQMLSLKQREAEIEKYRNQCISTGTPLPNHPKYHAKVCEEVSCNVELMKSIVEPVAPAMPVIKTNASQEHRQKISDQTFPLNVFVARPVGKKEISTTPAAKAALDKEWNKLVEAKVWESTPTEWSELAKIARDKGETIHVGRVLKFA